MIEFTRCRESLITASCTSEIVGNALGIIAGVAIPFIAAEGYSRIQKITNFEKFQRKIHKITTIFGGFLCISNNVPRSFLTGCLLISVFFSSLQPFVDHFPLQLAAGGHKVSAQSNGKTISKIKENAFVSLSFSLGMISSSVLSSIVKQSKVNLLTTYIAGNSVAYAASSIAAIVLKKN